MRDFKTVIFMGDGEFSRASCEFVHKKLDESFSILSGLQQGEPPEHCIETYKDFVRDIITSLGYEPDLTWTKVDYPGDDDSSARFDRMKELGLISDDDLKR